MTNFFIKDYWRKYVNIFMTERFIELQSYDEYNFTLSNTVISSEVLSIDAPDEVLGRALLKVLHQSCVLSKKESADIVPLWASSYGGWISKRMREFGYEDAYACFQNMNSCFVSSCDGEVMIRPQDHVELARWALQEDGSTNFFFPENIPPAELGAGLRIAFSHCTSKGNFDAAEVPVEKGKGSRLRSVTASDVSSSYDYMIFYFNDETDPFMDIGVSEDRELVFMFYEAPHDIQLNLAEWDEMQLQAEMFLPEALENEDQYQRHRRLEKGYSE